MNRRRLPPAPQIVYATIEAVVDDGVEMGIPAPVQFDSEHIEALGLSAIARLSDMPQVERHRASILVWYALGQLGEHRKK